MFLPQCPLVSCLPIESATLRNRAWPVSASAQNGLIDLRLGCSPLYEPLARSGCCLWVKMSGVSKSSDGHETLQQSLVINLQHLATQYLGLVKATWVLAQLQQKQDKHWLFRRTSLDETFEQGLDAVLPKLAASRFANFAIRLKSHDFILQEYSHCIFMRLQASSGVFRVLDSSCAKRLKITSRGKPWPRWKTGKIHKDSATLSEIHDFLQNLQALKALKGNSSIFFMLQKLWCGLAARPTAFSTAHPGTLSWRGDWQGLFPSRQNSQRISNSIWKKRQCQLRALTLGPACSKVPEYFLKPRIHCEWGSVECILAVATTNAVSLGHLSMSLSTSRMFCNNLGQRHQHPPCCDDEL